MEIYKCKWMVLGALGCMNNADFPFRHLFHSSLDTPLSLQVELYSIVIMLLFPQLGVLDAIENFCFQGTCFLFY